MLPYERHRCRLLQLINKAKHGCQRNAIETESASSSSNMVTMNGCGNRHLHGMHAQQVPQALPIPCRRRVSEFGSNRIYTRTTYGRAALLCRVAHAHRAHTVSIRIYRCCICMLYYIVLGPFNDQFFFLRAHLTNSDGGTL